MEDNRFETPHRPRNILVAVDASERSFEAVRYVGRILPAEGARITLFHVLNPVPECFLDLDRTPCFLHQSVDTRAWLAQQERLVDDFMERARGLLASLEYPATAVSVLIKGREAGIARDIAKEARQGYDTLVVGRRGMSDVQDLILGSVTNKLVSYLSETTVWVVGGQPDPTKILIAMDSSEGAGRALEYVAGIFGPSHPDLLLLHVSRGISPSLPGGEWEPADVDWLDRARVELGKAEKEMADFLADCCGRMEQQGADVGRIKTKIIPKVYSRAVAIFGEAKEEGCGTIVVGRRGLSRVEEFFMGRVSNKVLQLAREMAVWMIP